MPHDKQLPHGVSKRQPVKKREQHTHPRIKTISLDKLKIELDFAERAFCIEKRTFPDRLQLGIESIKESLGCYYKTKNPEHLDKAELAIRSYLQDQDDINPKVRRFIENTTEAALQNLIANTNRDSKKLNGFSPRLLTHHYNEKVPPNTFRSGGEVLLTGEMKQAYFSLTFVYIAITLLLENKIAPSNSKCAAK